MCCNTAQALVFLLVSVSYDTAQVLVFLLMSRCCDMHSPNQGQIDAWLSVIYNADSGHITNVSHTSLHASGVMWAAGGGFFTLFVLSFVIIL